jgi:hypothetical protein
MIIFTAVIVFIGSLAAILGLFGIKYRELRTERVFAPAMRIKADEQALRFKGALARGRRELAKLPPTLLHLSRIAVHEAALGIAYGARAAEQGAHRLADMVSHKHRFEKREPRSEFLKQMNEHKSGTGLGENENI